MNDLPFIDRDISWLSFNERVLQEAANLENPLYERIKFLAIYSSNLDEFFRVRVATLRSLRKLKKKTRQALGLKPREQLRLIRKVVGAQQERIGEIMEKDIIPGLESRGIRLLQRSAFNDAQQEWARNYFYEKAYPYLREHWLKSGEEMLLENKGLYFAIQFADTEELGIANIPSEELPRFLELPSPEGEWHYTYLDEIVRQFLPEVWKREIIGTYSIKLTRDADLGIEDEFSGDLLDRLKKALAKREVGPPVRLLYDQKVPKSVLEHIKTLFRFKNYDLMPGGRYHNFNDFFGFPDPTNSVDWHDEPLPPLDHPELEGVPTLMEAIEQKDRMLHFPYQRFDYLPQLIEEAAQHPDVTNIKITLYRVAGKSAVVQGLLNALKNGKSVLAFIEAKARFDEASNLYWGEQLEQAGATVVYSYPAIKVHTKLMMITRQVGGESHYMAYVGTGNFNEKTAKLYTDHGLLTADQKLCRELTQVFDLLNRKIILPKTKQVLISPFSLRDRFTEMMEKEIAAAERGETAYAMIKMNSLEDPEMIRLLYRASQAGVKIDMIVRGICCLIPGVTGWSENIRIVSIVDRFLEHARVYLFANGGAEKIYIASADWMTRNLDRRVEVAVPVKDSAIKAQLKQFLILQLSDNQRARTIDATQSNTVATNDEAPVRAQLAAYHWLASML